jgi:AraC-like DNA-binding protein
MENSGQKYLLCATDKSTRCFSNTDMNPIDKTSSLINPIQPSFPCGEGNFHTALPSVRYKNIIACYSQTYVVKNSLHWRTIFPEGGDAALVFRCDHHKPGAFLVGTPTCPREAEYVISGGDYFCIFFYPCMGYAFYPLPATELTDKSFSLDELIPEESESIIERVVLANTFQERIRVFETFMEKRMPFLTKIPDQIISNITAIHNIAGVITDERLEYYRMYTERHIRRLFQKYVGISPKLYTDILRHQKSLRILLANPYHDMDELALEAGYYDQSHFINKFKRFTGSTPAQFVRDVIQVEKHGLNPLF